MKLTLLSAASLLSFAAAFAPVSFGSDETDPSCRLLF